MRLLWLAFTFALASLVQLAHSACSYSVPTCATNVFLNFFKAPGCDGDQKCACQRLGSYDNLAQSIGEDCSKSDTEKTLSQLASYCRCVGAPIQSGADAATSSTTPLKTSSALPPEVSTTLLSAAPLGAPPAGRSSTSQPKSSDAPVSKQTTDVSSTTTTAASATAAETAPSKPSSEATNHEKYSTSDKIALGVGIGIGLPTLIVAVITLWRQRRRRS